MSTSGPVKWCVSPLCGDARRGVVTGPVFEAPCLLGEAGVRPEELKREGDKATPLGCFPFRRIYYRPDRTPKPVSRLEAIALRPDMGWCDDTSHGLYNQRVTLPFSASCEPMWRDDHLYDLVVEIGHNDAPPIPGFGSAIFLHVWRSPDSFTRGCIALEQIRLLEMVRLIQPGDQIAVKRSSVGLYAL